LSLPTEINGRQHEATAEVVNALRVIILGSRPPVSEIAGPREESLVEMARLLAARRGDTVKIEGVSDPADPDSRLNESGALLPGPDAILAGPTFEQWLDAR